MDSDELREEVIQHQCFSKGLPPMDVNGTNENDHPCIREDCDGTWVDNLR